MPRPDDSVLVVAGTCTSTELDAFTLEDVHERVWSALQRHMYVLDPSGAASDWRPWRDPNSFVYAIGGRWAGALVARSGPPILGELGTFQALGPTTSGWVRDLLATRRTDVVLAGDVDWDGMRAATLADAAEWYSTCAQEGRELEPRLLPAQISRSAYLRKFGSYGHAPAAICNGDSWQTIAVGESWRDWYRFWRGAVESLDPATLLVMVQTYD